MKYATQTLCQTLKKEINALDRNRTKLPALKLLVETGKNLERRPRKDDEAQSVQIQVVQPDPQGKGSGVTKPQTDLIGQEGPDKKAPKEYMG